MAILSIVLHNYCHWLKGAIFENEFTYQSWHVSKLLHYLAHPDIYLPLQLFSFFGHYGVVIFVFLSAYGLEKKYGRSTQEVHILPFIWTHYLKLLSICIVGYATYLLLNAYYTPYPSSVVFGILNQLRSSPLRLMLLAPTGTLGSHSSSTPSTASSSSVAHGA